MLSVVIPVFNEEGTLNIAADKVKTVLKKADIDFEIFFIDDGSTDRSWRIISELHAADRRIKGIRFSRNFGKDAAIFAGLKACGGDCVAVMDFRTLPKSCPKCTVCGSRALRLWRESKTTEARSLLSTEDLSIFSTSCFQNAPK